MLQRLLCSGLLSRPRPHPGEFEGQVDSDGRAVFEVGLGALVWYPLLNAVEGCRNIVLDLEAPPPLFLRIPDLLGESVFLWLYLVLLPGTGNLTT